MASPEPVKEALQVFEEKLNELEALLFEEVIEKTRNLPRLFLDVILSIFVEKINRIVFFF